MRMRSMRHSLGWAGTYAYPYVGTALLGILGTGYWNQGIVPGILLQTLLVRGHYLFGPPIALGAFVLGKGCGLLIGKLLGVRLVLRHLRPKHTHYHVDQGGWKQVHHSVGWKPWRLRLRLPFLNRFRLHRTYPPPPHFNFNSYPPIHHDYSSKPYGTYNYASEGWGQGGGQIIKDSGWLPGTGTENKYEETSSHVYDHSSRHGDHGSSGEYSDSSAHANYGSSPSSHSEGWSESYRRKKSLFDSTDAESGESSDVENFIKTEIYRMKSGDFNASMSEEDQETARKLLNEQFARDLLDSIEQKTVPDFVPFPENEEVLDPLSLNATSVESDVGLNGTKKEVPKSSNKKSKSGKKGKTVEDESPVDSILDTLFTSLQNFNPVNYVPERIVTWLTAGLEKDAKDAGKSNGEVKSRRKRGTNEVDVESATRSIVKDIRNLFSIISFLDISRCLERMVCEIHQRGKDITSSQLASSYEGTVITAFRIMDSIMPDDKDENVVKYREAARVGGKYETAETCVKNFPGCPISTNKLIELGSLISPSSLKKSIA